MAQLFTRNLHMGLTNNSSTKDLRKLPNNLLEASPQDLQALLSSVVKEAIAASQAEAAEKDKLARNREGALEILKLEHNSVQTLGIISLAAIAAFGASLGVFSDPKAWDDSFSIIDPPIFAIPMPRSLLITITFTAFLSSAIIAWGVQQHIRHEIRQVVTADEVTEIEAIQDKLKSLRNRGGRGRFLLFASFGVGAVAFLLFISQSAD